MENREKFLTYISYPRKGWDSSCRTLKLQKLIHELNTAREKNVIYSFHFSSCVCAYDVPEPTNTHEVVIQFHLNTLDSKIKKVRDYIVDTYNIIGPNVILNQKMIRVRV